MKLGILIAENEDLKATDLEQLQNDANLELRLPARNIELIIEPFAPITSPEIYDSVLNSVATTSTRPRILILDLELCGKKLRLKQTVDRFNSAVKKHDQPGLCIDLKSNDAARAGGYLLAWHALKSDSAKQFIVIASNQVGPLGTKALVSTFKEALRSRQRFDVLNGGLDMPSQRSSLFQQAINLWLKSFMDPRERLFPGYINTWFIPQRRPVPHDFKDISDVYRPAIAEYLSDALQLDEKVVTKHWDGMPSDDKRNLHNYLKHLVGSCASAYGGQYRLQFRHIPFLAAACTPAPGSWPFTSELLKTREKDLLTKGAAKEDETLLDHLLGKAGTESGGLFANLLTDKNNKALSTLHRCVSAPRIGNKMILEFEFNCWESGDNRTPLAIAFNNRMEGRTAELGGEVARMLHELHLFLSSHNAAVSFNANSPNQLHMEQVP